MYWILYSFRGAHFGTMSSLVAVDEVAEAQSKGKGYGTLVPLPSFWCFDAF